jgi:hypothetical protein
MKPSFGMYFNIDYEQVPDDYLCWICACYKGGVKAKHAGEKAWDKIPEEDYLEARRILKERGYNTKGVWPHK